MIKIKIDRDFTEDKADDINHECRWLLDDNSTVKDLVDKILSEYNLPISKWSGFSWSLYINEQKCVYINKYNKNIEYYIDKNSRLKDYQINDEFINTYLKISNRIIDDFFSILTFVLIIIVCFILIPLIIFYFMKIFFIV